MGESVALKYVAQVESGQSPPSEEVEPYVEGLPFLQGNAEFGRVNPEPTLQCGTPRKRCNVGDVLLSVRAPVGALNVADRPYGLGRGLCAVRASSCDPSFLWWWLHPQTSQLHSVATGSTYDAITSEDVRALKFPLLPVGEQRRIAAFLNAEVSRIDQTARARYRMVELLQLRKDRVTLKVLGLDESVIGSSMVQLGYRVRQISVGIVVTPAAWYVEGGGVPALRGINVRPGRIELSNLVRISREGHALHSKSSLRGGDIVVVRTGDAGTAAVVPSELEGSNCIDLIVIRPGGSMHPGYLDRLLNSSYSARRVEEYSVGSIQSHYNVGALKRMPVPLIPMDEQRELVQRLDNEIRPMSALIEQLELQVRLLIERRQALITAAVTGQFDVSTARGVAV